MTFEAERIAAHARLLIRIAALVATAAGRSGHSRVHRLARIDHGPAAQADNRQNHQSQPETHRHDHASWSVRTAVGWGSDRAAIGALKILADHGFDCNEPRRRSALPTGAVVNVTSRWTRACRPLQCSRQGVREVLAGEAATSTMAARESMWNAAEDLVAKK